jgi:glycosyltransferase involved in cell wall biosynthesis
MKLLIGSGYYGSGNVQQLLDSIENSNVLQKLSVRVVVIDQNLSEFKVKPNRYKNIELVILRQKPGLSAAKNTVINLASKDEYVWFLDDDCLVTESSLLNLTHIINAEPHAMGYVFAIGSVDDANKDTLRKWPRKKINLSKTGLFYFGCSINVVFTPRSRLKKFDETLGLGADYQSCEDKDHLLRNFERGEFYYIPLINVLHPNETYTCQPLSKQLKYANGFGAFCRKHNLLGVLYFIMYIILLLKRDFMGVNTRLRIRSMFQGYRYIKCE